MSTNRTITVKGVGKVIARPNTIVIQFDLVSKDMDYDTTMDQAAIKHEQLRNALASIGIDPTELKTTDFSINTNYITETDRTGNARRIFDGYISHHRLRLELYFDMKVLSQVMDAIAQSGSLPEFNIAFTIQDKQHLTQELLTDAVNNAILNANILARAAGVLLRNIITITYDWAQLHPYSQTRYDTYHENLMRSEAKTIDIEPDDIEVSDYVTITWDIVS